MHLKRLNEHAEYITRIHYPYTHTHTHTHTFLYHLNRLLLDAASSSSITLQKFRYQT